MRCAAPVSRRSSLSRSKRSVSERQRKRQVATPFGVSPTLGPRLATAEVSGSDLILTFDRPVFLSGSPTGWTTDVAEAETSAEITGPNEVTITFSGSVAGATTVNAPTANGGIRGADNGLAVIPSADVPFPPIG